MLARLSLCVARLPRCRAGAPQGDCGLAPGGRPGPGGTGGVWPREGRRRGRARYLHSARPPGPHSRRHQLCFVSLRLDGHPRMRTTPPQHSSSRRRLLLLLTAINAAAAVAYCCNRRRRRCAALCTLRCAGRRPKRVERYEGGERARYFADDDKLDLGTLVKRTKYEVGGSVCASPRQLFLRCT